VENIDVAILFTVILAFFIFVIVLIPISAIFALDNFNRNEIKKNDPPVIVILHKVKANAGQLVTLDASKSIDPDRDPIKFSWKKISADNLDIDLMNDRSSIASFVAPPIMSQTTVVFRLSVVDVNGNTDSDQIQVILSKKTGKDKQEGQTLMGKPKLNNINNKVDKTDKSQSKLLGLSSMNKNQNIQTQSELSDESRKDSRVAGNQIKVNAGSDTEAFGGEIVTLSGKISSNLNSNQIKMSWKQTKGLHVQLSSNHIFDPLFIAPNVKKTEKIEFALYASDQHGVVASDSVTIVVIPGSSKEGQVSNKDGQNTSPTKVESDNASTRIDQPPPLSSEQLMVSSSSLDATPPTVVSTKPATGAIGVAVSSTITATFGEVVQGLTVNPATFTLKNSGGTSIPGLVTLSSDGRTGIFTPSSPLAFSTSYTATVRGVRDLAGNTMITAKSWSFTTTSSVFQITTTSLYDNFQGSTYALKDGMTSPNGKWLDKWNGYGQAGVKTLSGNNIFYQIPKASTKSSETHSGLVVSKQKFSDITLDIDMKTYKQTRQNSPPNAWEAAWVMWRWVDLYHHYYFVIKTNGIEFGKKDTSCNCEKQVFLKTGTSPKLQIGAWNHIKISSIGKHTTIWVGGVKVVDMNDPSYNSAKMSSGFIGLYTEDASVGFDNVYIGK
jgi:Bacterial Ig-like domain/Domain of Unknown Function (DUF1080)